MGLFQTRKPRGFNYTPRYYDPEREKWKKVEEDAKRRLGIIPPKEFKPEDLKGAFVEATKHLKKRKERGKPRLNSGVLVIAMVFLFAILYFLVTS